MLEEVLATNVCIDAPVAGCMVQDNSCNDHLAFCMHDCTTRDKLFTSCREVYAGGAHNLQ